ncbi:unnamed protein product [Allacma fusca]|uniref:Uncharacterized protein n=1 Tax=Allacma fusca TaxID=39272 RepID=A0A8J2KEF7_9HEXA|nr:unnamed protein product [Allacma fusca]
MEGANNNCGSCACGSSPGGSCEGSKSTNARWDHSWDMLSPEHSSRSLACGGCITYFIGIFIQNGLDQRAIKMLATSHALVGEIYLWSLCLKLLRFSLEY